MKNVLKLLKRFVGLDIESETESKHNYPWKIFYKVTFFQFLIIFSALGGIYFIVKHQFGKQADSQIQSHLINIVNIFKLYVPDKVNQDWCSQISEVSNVRITVINPRGEILCDSDRDVIEMDNHNDRPEVVSAKEGKVGVSRRYSKTLSVDMLYVAMAVSNGNIIRCAVAVENVSKTMSIYNNYVFLSIIIVFTILVAGMFWSMKKLVFPVGRLLVKAKNIAQARYYAIEDPASETDKDWDEFETVIDNIHRNLMTQTQTSKLEQRQLETIIGAISDAIIAVNSLGEILFFNIHSEMLFGSTKLRKRGVKVWEIFQHPTILKAFRFTLNNGKRFDTKTLEFQIPPISEKISKKFFSLSVSPVFNEDGSIYGAVGIFHDVTEMKSVEQLRIDFVANVSHELRTPLTSIKGYAETLKEDIKNNKPLSGEFIDAILRNSNRLMSLLNDLLDLSSIESSDVLKKELVNVEELTNKVIEQLKDKFLNKNQKINTKILIPSLFADRNRVEQVLVNLLTNANKYTQEGGEISILWYNEKNEIFLKVIDNGPGISERDQARLFERFYRVDKARSREEGGTGLGLAIVKHIMQKHGGKVWVESSLGKGSVFICQFPENNY